MVNVDGVAAAVTNERTARAKLPSRPVSARPPRVEAVSLHFKGTALVVQ